MSAPKLLAVAGTFYRDIADALIKGAQDAAAAAGAEIDIVEVPGALEIPAAIKFAAQSGKFDGYVALGCVIRGETTHYDYVCAESAHGLQVLAMTLGLCIGNGILTTENRDQAWVRADKAQKNKGRDAAEAALSLVRLKQQYAS